MPTIITAPNRPILAFNIGTLRRLGTLVFSFEAFFVMFLFSNQIESLIPVQINLTLILFAVSVACGAWVLAHEGIYIAGLAPICIGLLFVIWASISYLWTPSVIMASKKVYALATFNVWCMISATLVIGPRPTRVTRLFLCLLVASGFFALYGISIYLLYGHFRGSEGFEAQEGGRAYISWGRAVGLGMIVAFLITIRAYAFSLKQVASGGLLVSCVFFLLVGGGRGPLLAVSFACLVPLLLGPSLSRQGLFMLRSQLLSLLLVVLTAVVIAVLASGAGTDTLNRLASLIEFLADDDRIDVGENRLDKFAEAYRLWLAAPLVGHGIASFGKLTNGHEIIMGYPHNLFLECLAELGIIGLGLILSYAWLCLRRVSIARLRTEPMLLCALMLAVFTTLNSMISADLVNNRVAFFAIGLLAMRSAVPRNKVSGLPRSKSRASA